MLMDPHGHWGITKDGDEGKIVPETKNEDVDEDHFNWWEIV
jgi:hypothetical protein